MNSAQADYQKIHSVRHASREREPDSRQRRTDRGRERGGEADNGPDNFDLLMAIPFMGLPRERRLVILREAENRAEANERRRIEETVNVWRGQVDVLNSSVRSVE